MYNEKRKLYQDEKEVLLSYYEYKNRFAEIYFKIPQVMAAIVIASGALYPVIEWVEFRNSIGKLIFWYFELFLMYKIFFSVPRFLVKSLRREQTAIENDTASVYTVRALNKLPVSKIRNGHRTSAYRIEAVIDFGRGPEQKIISTSLQCYSHIEAGDVCYAVFFPDEKRLSKGMTEGSETHPEIFTEIFDFEFKSLKSTMDIE